jgi:RNA polymerase sigma-70 factor (ECF subfamily)
VKSDAEAPSDEALAARAQRGDQPAFGSLVNRHKHFLYRVVRRYVGNADDAYDVVQDTFISAWEALSRYDPGRPFVAWLRTIALNKCRDFGRRRKFRWLMLQAFAAEPVAVPGSRAQDLHREQESRENDRLRQLDQAIAALPAFYKEPLILTTVGGLSQSEAATALKTTPKAIEMRLRRARRRLAETLGEPQDREG